MMGLMMRKSALDIVGGFDVKSKWAMDLDMLLRLRKVGKFINTKTTLSAFRWHTSSQTVSNRPKVLDETEKIKRKYLPRYIRPFSFLWEQPVRFATKLAVKKVNSLARRSE
jgi:GT2 family glycosyltransferase